MHVAYEPDAKWTIERTILAIIANSLNMLIWGMSDKSKRGKRPQLIGPSYLRNKQRTLDAQVMTIDELMEKLNKPRG